MKHGAYVNELLDEKEKIIFDEYYQQLNSDFTLNDSSDRMSAELACIYFVKLTRAIKGGNGEVIYKMDLLVRNQLVPGETLAYLSNMTGSCVYDDTQKIIHPSGGLFSTHAGNGSNDSC